MWSSSSDQSSSDYDALEIVGLDFDDADEPPRQRMRYNPRPQETITPMLLRSGRAVTVPSSTVVSNTNAPSPSLAELAAAVVPIGQSHLDVIDVDDDDTSNPEEAYSSQEYAEEVSFESTFSEIAFSDYSTPSFESYDLNALSDVPISSPLSSDGSVSSHGDEDNYNENTLNLEVTGRFRERRNAIVPGGTTDSVSDNGSTSLPFSTVLIPTAPEIKPSTSTTAVDLNCSNDDDVCIICCEPFTNSGNHRLCCLKCGHSYGKMCIEKWIKNENRCPQCNAKAHKRDVRVLYVKNLKALDTTERDRLHDELDKEQEQKRKLELECNRLRQAANEADMKYKYLAEEHRCLKERAGNFYRGEKRSVEEKLQIAAPTVKRFVPNFNLPFRDGECRVGAYDEWLNLLVVSQNVRSSLYPLGCFGIRKINLMTGRANALTPLHQKEIRDMEFSNENGDVLLTVGLDKKAILTNCVNNVTVQCFTTDTALWSCAWSKGGNNHIFYVGTSNGKILVYDIRRPGEQIKTLAMPSNDRTPVSRIRFITASHDNKSSFKMTGLLVQRLNSCWFCELKNEDFKFHQLPVEGSFISADFETMSRKVLISTRPSFQDTKTAGSHMICELSQYYSDIQQHHICSCDIVHSYQGHDVRLGKLTRAAIFAPEKNNVVLAAEVGAGHKSIVNVWNVPDAKPQQVLNTEGEAVLDFIPCRINNEFLLGTVSSNNLNIYKMQ